MSKFYFLLICLFSLGFLSAQEKLTKEEKARRDKNIQAGNPFAKFGSKVKIATLSKGKYLEFHDLDSIVIIGTIRWHVYKNKIVGDIIIDSINPDARPIGDVAGLWISPDPLSEEFPSWSPYSFSFNNPIRFVDPDGRAPKDHYRLNQDGTLTFLQKTKGRDVIYNSNYTEAMIVPKSFIESKVVVTRGTTNTSIYELNSYDTDKVFNFLARNSSSEFGMQKYKIGNNQRTFIYTANNLGNAGFGGYYASEQIMDKNRNAILLQDVHSHTDISWSEKDGKGTYLMPSGFLTNGNVNYNDYRGDVSYRNYFEQKYSGRITNNFEIRMFPLTGTPHAKKFNPQIHFKYYGKSIFYSSQKYFPNYNREDSK